MLSDMSALLEILRAKSPKPRGPARLKVVKIKFGLNNQKAYINYESDPRIYDSGKRVILAYRRNQDDPDCVENRLLDWKVDKEGVTRENAVMNVLDELLPNISHFYDTVTLVTVETIQGKLTSTVTEDLKEIIPYIPIPAELSHIRTVPITDLDKIITLDMDVDRVKWNGKTYAFKLTGNNLRGTLQELSTLDRLSHSPYIINLEAIVVNRDNTIRGFLSPFMHAGDLENVFRTVRRNRGLAEDSETTAIDWSLKLSWARQITQAVVELHAISVYNGDLKPQNVLIDAAGQAVLIDFLPVGISADFAAPEVLEKWQEDGTSFESILTAQADIYSLGVTLWAVAEEKWQGTSSPVWRDGATPAWYRDIVHKCLLEDPAMRPSSVEILSLLQNGGS